MTLTLIKGHNVIEQGFNANYLTEFSICLDEFSFLLKLVGLMGPMLSLSHLISVHREPCIYVKDKQTTSKPSTSACMQTYTSRFFANVTCDTPLNASV